MAETATDTDTRTDRVSVRVPRPLLEDVDRLVERGVHETRSAAIRTALRQLDGVADDATPTDRHPEYALAVPDGVAVADGGRESEPNSDACQNNEP